MKQSGAYLTGTPQIAARGKALMDTLAVMARDAHRNAVENVRLAAHFREQRDDAIRRLYEQGGISYTQIAEQVGITRELVAKIVQGRGRGLLSRAREGM